MSEPLDLTGLPDELLQELACAKTDRMTEALISMMATRDEPQTLDQLLVGLYHGTGKIYKRRFLQNKLYRIEEVESVEGTKGVYRLHPAVRATIESTGSWPPPPKEAPND